jgi:ribosomal protein S18 acetylase RimI-like enzyme
VVVFTTPTIRTYKESDLPELIKVYQSAFSEPPWNESWTSKEVREDLEFALSQMDNIVLVAEAGKGLAGFSGGYRLPIEKFPWLSEDSTLEASYMDEIAISGSNRRKNVGSLLGEEYLRVAREQGMKRVTLRTDIWNTASMALFRKLGFENTGVFDPKYKDRIYLSRTLENER